MTWQIKEYKLIFKRLGVAAFDSEDNATNQAFGISIGKPTGMPAIFGVRVKVWPGSSKPGAVQLMQAYPPRRQEPSPFHKRAMSRRKAWSTCAPHPTSTHNYYIKYPLAKS